GMPRAHWGVLAERVRATGQIVPARAVTLQVPQFHQQFAQLTLAFIAPSGIHVRRGQRVAAFDRTQLADAAADAEAQYRGLGSQVREMEAKNAAEAAQRAVALRKALAAQGHARLELEKRPVLTGLEIATDQVQLADARAHVHSLRQAGQWLTQEAAAKLRALRLQRDEQKVLWQRALQDSQRMVLHAPMAGMLALALPPYMGQAVPGAKLYGGVPLLQIFDPSRMQVQAQISELDLAWMSPGVQAQVRIDAYPGLVLPAHLLRLNPIAVSAVGITPIHNFSATFALDRGDPRALPGLNASVEIASAPRAGWLVPRAAVHYLHGQAFVWGRGARGRLRRPVQVVAFGRQWIEIRAPWLGPGPGGARSPGRS
ncbi:MAG: efflux RND transporter periplasmic adaptor subunit, partial [Terriglobales bacterium]